MNFAVRVARVAIAMALLTCVLSSDAAAQGITSAAIRGRVLDAAGQPVADAVVTVINTATGQTYTGRSRSDGRYNIENVAVGGPYTIEARRIGFQPILRTDLTLALGQAMELELEIQQSAVQLEEITVQVSADEQSALTAVSRTGTADYIGDTAIARLPSLNRNFTDFVVTVPQVANAGGVSAGGAHRKLNNIQIDGVSDNDLFGLGATGQPGGQAGAKSITLEAVKEYQVLLAPYDVRQGGFVGGLINAVTKRGENTPHGSAFFYFQSDNLVRDSLPADASTFGQYEQQQFGFSIGGPISRNLAHFFFALERQNREIPIPGSTIGREPIQVTQIQPDSAQRVSDILQNVYGIDAGSFGAVPISTPNTNAFFRFDFQLGEPHQLMFRLNYVDASADNQNHNSATNYRFTSNAYSFETQTTSFALQLNSTIASGKYFNELRVGWNRTRDRRNPEVRYPGLDIDNLSTIDGADAANQFRLGAEQFSQLNSLDYDIFEFTDDFTIPTGNHNIIVGTHNEYVSFDNKFFHSSIGVWDFPSVAALEAGQPDQYFRQIPFSAERGIPVADWNVLQLGFYAQDQWTVTPTLMLTGGLRVDIPLILDNPTLNPAVQSSFGLNTSEMPSGNLLWSPKLGINWALQDSRATVVRGGTGIFTGRPAYVWLSNAFTNTGQEVRQVNCSASAGNMPGFSVDPSTQPQSCSGGSGVTAPTSQINTFASDFKFPQLWKSSLAIDQRLPLGILGTVEFMYNKGVNTIFQTELNIPQQPIGTNSEGRQMFGTGSSNGSGAQRVDPAFTQVLNHTNASKDRTYNLTFQAQKMFGQGFAFSLGYTYSDVQDLTALTSSIATSNFGFRPISQGGSANNPPLSVSWYSVPHSITASGTVNIPIPYVPSNFTLLYVGQSGQPYTWTVDGDANGDGYEGPGISRRNNDIVYVPSAASDFSAESPEDWTLYNALIESESCLSAARGTIPARNTCRNAWRNRLDASLRFSFGRNLGQQRHNLTLVWEVFNLLNLLNADWGTVDAVSFNETRELLDWRGYDAANDRPIYRYAGPTDLTAKSSVANTLSRWRMQLGLRWDF